MTTMAEPEWDQATRDLVLALDAVPTCSVCGGPSYLCQDPDRQFDWKAGDPVRCHADTAIRERQRGVTHDTNPYPESLTWPLLLRADAGGGG